VRWLVTGGAGYIGAHVTRALCAAGHETLVLDDLSTGLRRRVPSGVPLVRADIRDGATVANTVARFRPHGVVHLAARKDVAESTASPLTYYDANLEGLRSVLTACASNGAGSVLFSSSAAVYGTPATCPVTEDDPTVPGNPYGRTKLVGEWMLRDAAASAGFGWAALRYFNVAGAAAPQLRDVGGTNLVPRLLASARTGEPVQVYGGDWPTPDGSAVRDYVHVADVADAHACVAAALAGGAIRAEVLNIGRGQGTSVLEMIAAVGAATGRRLGYAVAPRRPGDPAEVVASADRIRDRLGWTARYGLADIVRSAADPTHALLPA
jgi:UDP-glucose 4-epimerase